MIIRRFRVYLLLVIFAAFPAFALDLVRDSEPRGEIILSSDATETELFVAGDFKKIIREMTSADLPLLQSPSGKKNTKIFIGKYFANEFKKDLERLKDSDGFAIRSKGSNIYVFGDVPRGTGYGVYHLLESNTDIIWARPDVNFGTVFSGTPNIDLKNIDVLEKNVFPIHGWNVAGIRGDEPTGVWVFRNRGNIAELTNTPYLRWLDVAGYGHAYWHMVPPGKYFKTNPEFYGSNEIKGGRTPDTLCLTNEKMIALAAQNMIADTKSRFPVTPGYMMLGMRDSSVMCQCETCLMPIKMQDGRQLKVRDRDSQKDPVYYSTRYFMFMNKLVAEIKKEYPEMKFLIAAYVYAVEPPACALDESIYINLCPVGGIDGRYPLLDPRQNPAWRRRFEGWLGKAPGRICFYEYYRSCTSDYAVVTGALDSRRASVANLRALADHKGKGVEAELTPDSEKKFLNHPMKSEWDANSINAWIYSRLMWNPYQDVDGLREYYLARTFREAAPAMKRFYESLALGVARHNKPKGGFPEKFVQTGVVEDCLSALNDAERLAKHPHSLEMIRRLKEQWMVNVERAGRMVVPKLDESGSVFDFGATCWEKAAILNDFRIPAYRDWGAKNPAFRQAEIRMLRDKTNLYFFYKGFNTQPNFMPPGDLEKFPSGERCEIYLTNENKVYLFAFDGNGNRYDARNYDRQWNSLWKVRVRKQTDSWQAIVAIPVSTLDLTANRSQKRLGLDVVRFYDDGKIREESTIKGELPGRMREPREFVVEEGP